MPDKPKWFRGPGDCYDKHGIPIHPGDLLRTPHFRGPRRRIYYLYHVACLMRDDETGHEYLRMVPASRLDLSKRRRGGDPMLSDELASEAEVINGDHVGDAVLIHERPRKKQETEP